MAIRYVGPGGNDGNNGLTWALRKLTLNGVEDTPVVAGDTVYVGPGVYREMLVGDVSGNLGNIITYIADVSGEHTDSVGGIVRVTGSDNDQTVVRARGIDVNEKDYRTFRGFYVDTCSTAGIDINKCENVIIEDCVVFHCPTGIAGSGTDSLNCTIRRCIIILQENYCIAFWDAATTDDNGHLIENCILGMTPTVAVEINRTGGITVRNCFIAGCYMGIRVNVALAIGQTITVNNCVLTSLEFGVSATAIGEIVENYNTFFMNNTDRANTNVGAQSQAYTPIMLPPLLHSGVSQISGFKFPWWIGELSEWSQIAAITGSNEPTEDLRGIARPVTASKNSWGPCQFFDMERETGTVRTGSVSIVLHDAGRHQIWVPVTATSTTIKIYVYREANYAGLLPQMIIKQPNVADRVTTDVGAVGGWNLLTDTFVPAALPPYVVVELVSRNTAVALAYETFFDDLDVS